MKYLDRRNIATRARDRWLGQYPEGDDYSEHQFDVNQHREKLLALGDIPTPADIVEIIGESWIENCSECKATGVAVVEIGHDADTGWTEDDELA